MESPSLVANPFCNKSSAHELQKYPCFLMYLISSKILPEFEHPFPAHCLYASKALSFVRFMGIPPIEPRLMLPVDGSLNHFHRLASRFLPFLCSGSLML